MNYQCCAMNQYGGGRCQSRKSIVEIALNEENQAGLQESDVSSGLFGNSIYLCHVHRRRLAAIYDRKPVFLFNGDAMVPVDNELVGYNENVTFALYRQTTFVGKVAID